MVLLDEVEKAHPEVLNVLLSVMDDGRLTDGKGRTVNFANTLLIMTSNLGSEFLTESANQAGEERTRAEGLALGVVHRHFRPEVRVVPASRPSPDSDTVRVRALDCLNEVWTTGITCLLLEVLKTCLVCETQLCDTAAPHICHP